MDATTVRRFDLVKLNSHGRWVLPRLMEVYPHLTERSAAGWLATLVNNNEFLFLETDDAVGLAQAVQAHMLQQKPIVQEHFVFCRERENKEHRTQAAGMYDRFAAWAKSLGAEILVVEERTDVPHELIKARLGRVFQRQVQFARV